MAAQAYSKKVMDLFHHPRNMGEMKDPDGVGKVGNPVCGDVMWIYIKVGRNKAGEEIIKDIRVKTFGCLPAGERIVVKTGGWKSISEVSKGEGVVNSDGKETSVNKTMFREHKGRMLRIVPFVSPYNNFEVTPEHPVLCVKRKWLKSRKSSSKCSWLRVKKGNLLSSNPDYVEASKLEVGDYLIFSYNSGVSDKQKYTRDLMRLIGYYLSEGYITAKGNAVAFAFNKNEKDNIREVKSLIKSITGKQGNQRTRGNVTEVYICSAKLARELHSIAGKLARHKSLSTEFMLLPPEKQMETIKTFLIGDGDIYRRRPKNSRTYRLATASEDLAIQFQEILARNGIFSSITVRKRKNQHKIEGRKIQGSDLYIISYKKNRKHHFVHKREGYFMVPIRRIESEPYDDIVYNFHVEREPNSYLVKGFAVHNCVAAIATSSQITEMARGKTLDEAMKISNRDIVDLVDGLPPQKIHCSVLAADALRNAIKDYRKRKG